jgi:hypothetical protein
MWIVAVAWIYVVGLMSLTETSFIAGVMTFVCYCLIPLSILYYLATTNKRRERRRQERDEIPEDIPSNLLDVDD